MSEEERQLDLALEALARRALVLVGTGVAPPELGDAIHGFMPGDPIGVKIKELLSLQIVQHRLEFDVAEEVCERLSGLDGWVRL